MPEDKLSDDFQKDAEKQLAEFFDETQREKDRLAEVSRESTSREEYVGHVRLEVEIEKLREKGVAPEVVDSLLKEYAEFRESLENLLKSKDRTVEALVREIHRFSPLVQYQKIDQIVKENLPLFYIMFQNANYLTLMKNAGFTESQMHDIKSAAASSDEEQMKTACAFFAQTGIFKIIEYAQKTENRLLPVVGFLEMVRKSFPQHAEAAGLDVSGVPKEIDASDKDQLNHCQTVLGDLLQKYWNAAAKEQKVLTMNGDETSLKSKSDIMEAENKKYAAIISKIYRRINQFLNDRHVSLPEADNMKYIENGLEYVLACFDLHSKKQTGNHSAP
jgi:hypothetical protein